MRKLSAALHEEGRKLSMCVGYYPAMIEEPFNFWYDPQVIAETCDMVRIMGYDMYYAFGKAQPELLDRDDCQGIGPTCTAPWLKDALCFWTRYVPVKKIILGLPAYGNDYNMIPGKSGSQLFITQPKTAKGTTAEKAWLWYEKVHIYRYQDKNGEPHIFFASDAKSTKALLEIADEFKITKISLWHYSEVDPSIKNVVREWLIN